uniref:Uncharacterized protein n=1 Tax=uncultured marine virus TaxID=186617 RepID=A0A0F7L0R4_9VIRU|nr:hypothetical protein [uncultured marine virus]
MLSLVLIVVLTTHQDLIVLTMLQVVIKKMMILDMVGQPLLFMVDLTQGFFQQAYQLSSTEQL